MACSAKITKNIAELLPRPLPSANQYTMPAIRIPAQFFEIRNNASPDRVQVNVADQLFEIHILLADNGFVTVLK